MLAYLSYQFAVVWSVMQSFSWQLNSCSCWQNCNFALHFNCFKAS